MTRLEKRITAHNYGPKETPRGTEFKAWIISLLEEHEYSAKELDQIFQIINQ